MVTRIQFEVNEQLRDVLDALMKDTGIKTRKDLLNRALSLFEWAIREKKAGRKVVSLDEESKNYREVVMLGLS